MKKSELLHFFLSDFSFAERAFALLLVLFEEDIIDTREAAAVLRGAKHHWKALLIIVGLRTNGTVKLDLLFDEASWTNNIHLFFIMIHISNLQPKKRQEGI